MPDPDKAPVLVMASRSPSAYSAKREAEPVLVAQTSSEVILVLDDGEELRFDQTELRRALEDRRVPVAEAVARMPKDDR